MTDRQAVGEQLTLKIRKLSMEKFQSIESVVLIIEEFLYLISIQYDAYLKILAKKLSSCR